MRNLKKKIFEITALTVIMLFLSSSVIAQVEETQKDTTKQDTTTLQTTLPQEQNQRTNQEIDSQEPDKGVDYSETIDKSEILQEVSNSLEELYPAHEVTEVFKGDDDSYKVKVKNENDEAFVYYNAEGDFVRAYNLSGLQQEGALPQDQSQRTQDSQEQSQWGTDDRPTQQGTSGTQARQDNQQGSQESESDDLRTQKSTQGNQNETQGTWGTNSDTDDDAREIQGTQQSNKSTQQETQGTWGTNSDMDDARETQQGTQQSNKSTQQETQGTWGDSDTDDERRVTQQGTYGTQQGAMDTERSSSYPQDQGEGDRSDDELRSQDSDKGIDYSESIEESDLPEEVTNSLEELYPAHEIEKINRGDDDSFKVKVTNQDDEAVVYYNSEGDFLRARSLNEMQGASPQEQSQRTLESQDQDQWGTDDNQKGTQMGTGTETRSNQQDTQQNWGTETENMGTQQQGTQMGAGTQTRSKDLGTDSKKESDNIGGNWGTDNQGAHEGAWESDDATGTQQGTTEAWGDTARNVGSAYPQEQNQRIQEQTTWGTQGERSTDSDFGSEDTTQTQGEDYTAPVDTVASPQEQFQRGAGEVDYSEEIEENELPESVTSSLDELYPEHEIEKAYKGDDGSYKIKVKNDDDQSVIYYDSEGQFSKDENRNDMKHKDDNKNTNQDW